MSDNTEWTFAGQFPDLSDETLLAYDVETKDPEIKTKGPGGLRKDGFICGFSIAGEKTGFKGYFPLRHEGGGNVPDPEAAVRWLQAQTSRNIPITGANLLYDLEMTKAYFNFELKGPKWDIQVADPLLDENWPTYRLNAIAERRLGLHKDEDLLYRKGAEFLGFTCKKEDEAERKAEVADFVKNNLWKLPAAFVGAYGEGDVALPIQIFRLQEKELKEQGLWSIFEMETRVLDLLLAMRFQGVPVDIPKSERITAEMEQELETVMKALSMRMGFRPDIWSAESLATGCDKLGLVYPKTAPKKHKKSGKEIGNKPSFASEWLDMQEHPVFQMILEARQIDRCSSVFIKDKIIGSAVNGRVHTQYHQVKSDRGGTASGRFASSGPNLQNMPSRNEKLAKRLRSIFVAEPGCEWGCFDVSQQEPRFTVHYASLMNLPGAEEAVEQYKTNPRMSYHKYVQSISGLEYKDAKQLNLGLAYGMGPKKYSEQFGVPYRDALALFDTYHEKLPFIRCMTRQCENVVKARGYLKTYMGRHSHFNLYGPPEFNKDETPPLHKEEAIKKYGYPIVQYFTYRAMNRLIQGSSADMIKKAMLDCFDAGYLPHLTVHDELDFANITSMKQKKEIHDIMVNSVQLRVPIVLDVECGPNWGEIEKQEVF